ncbi:DNA damage-inducible transcript 4 protein-like [Chanos chanos]|uniref:DNA damage-inducible transcript 4 protein n=1 Tax=Chanos chanos TaxID=29144 RepID=A0A6J2V5P1_CHACN|nr:DNA damage-inducible transcript 4 protein-like [Chanos chanos]
MDCSCPPSPPGSGLSRPLPWDRLMQKLFEHNLTSQILNTNESKRRNSGSTVELKDPFEETLCAEVMTFISQTLSETKVGVLGCSSLLIPGELLEHIGQELLHLADSEPCGLRGAVLDVCVENKNSRQRVEQFAVDPYVVPTFHLTLVLRPDLEGLWPRFARRLGHSFRLSTSFKIIKQKLYCSGELITEEF